MFLNNPFEFPLWLLLETTNKMSQSNMLFPRLLLQRWQWREVIFRSREKHECCRGGSEEKWFFAVEKSTNVAEVAVKRSDFSQSRKARPLQRWQCSFGEVVVRKSRTVESNQYYLFPILVPLSTFSESPLLLLLPWLPTRGWVWSFLGAPCHVMSCLVWVLYESGLVWSGLYVLLVAWYWEEVKVDMTSNQ